MPGNLCPVSGKRAMLDLVLACDVPGAAVRNGNIFLSFVPPAIILCLSPREPSFKGVPVLLFRK